MKTKTSRQVCSIVWAGTISFVIVMGLGRFAFTPLLPMMLHDHVIDLQGGTFLASIHYVGYLLGALFCMLLPWLLRQCHWAIPSQSAMVRYSLVATALFIFGMSLSLPSLWPLFRCLTGVSSAVAFVYTSGWCLEQLAQLESLSLSGVIYAGPGLGIVISGLVSIAMGSLHFSSSMAWLGFSLLAALFTGTVWNIFQADACKAASVLETKDPFIPVQEVWKWEHILLAIAYGLAGFGYIITATFLPVIAHETIPKSPWIHFFWPLFGVSVVIGALSAQKIPITIDRRSILFWIYMMQLIGVLMPLWFPNQWGFFLGIILLGFPFNLLSLFGMQEARRLRPAETTILMGLLTAMYGFGQILGPSVTSYFLSHTKNHAEGFSFSLRTAAASLLVGGGLYLLMKFLYPFNKTGRGKVKS
ncbi:MAG: YbfB/YjiJ family MFS transporter [Chthoniobacterales bacterium]